MKRCFRTCWIALALLAVGTELFAQTVGEGPEAAEAVVRELYDHFKFDAGALPDWDQVRAAFLPEAVIVLRTSREATTVFTVDGFIQDWLTFIEAANVEARGFSETIIKSHTTLMGTMASMMVLYEAQFPDSERRQQGVDIFLLTLRPEGWKIVALTNELPMPGHAIPEPLLP